METQIGSLVTAEDIEYINTFRSEWNIPSVDYNTLIQNATNWLSEMQQEQAVINLIRKGGKDIIFGGHRIPFLVYAQDREPFIIKGYDIWSGREEEIEVLKVVQGKVAPEVLFYGSDFYAEKYIPIDDSQTLAELAGKDMDTALGLAGKAQAEIANLSIDYNHSKLLDEVRLYQGKLLVTDFGTSRRFVSKKDSAFKSWIYCIETEGLEFFMSTYTKELSKKGNKEYAGIYPFFGELETILTNISQDPTELFNIAHITLKSALGIKNHFTSLDVYNNKLAWAITLNNFKFFLESFKETYNPSK